MRRFGAVIGVTDCHGDDGRRIDDRYPGQLRDLQWTSQMAETGVTMVFVVDDDPQVRASIKGLLKSAGLRSESFETAEQFLERRRPEGPSCLIADVSLPGISGLDFQQQLKKGGLQIPIVFITAHGDYSMTVKAIKSGAVEFLTKPFEDYDLWQSGLCALPCDPLFFHRTFPRADHVQFASSCVRSLGICFCLRLIRIWF
jgi:CheY-like chemotaxis protein